MNPLRNLITDVPGVLIGNAQDVRLASGATAIVFEAPAVGSIDVRGGGPGTRETALLDPAQTVQGIDAIALSGGSAFGLDAASGVQAWLREQGRGFAVRSARVPIVPGAILFDLLNGGDKDWGRYPPYRDLGYQAAADAGTAFELGSVGAGLGATTVNFKGGLGSASARAAASRSARSRPSTLPAVSLSPTAPGFGRRRSSAMANTAAPACRRHWPAGALDPVTKANPRTSTTLAVVATDAVLTKAEAKRLAVMAQTGMARAIYPVHTPLDGDVVFAVSTGRMPLADPMLGLTALGTVAANCVARAIARAVYEAAALPQPGALPAWRDRFGRRG